MNRNQESICDSCGEPIHKNKWKNTGFFNSKVKCENCDAEYKIKYGYILLMMLPIIFIPTFAFDNSWLRFGAMLLMAFLISRFSNKSWFENL